MSNCINWVWFLGQLLERVTAAAGYKLGDLPRHSAPNVDGTPKASARAATPRETSGVKKDPEDWESSFSARAK